jgi:hypothetical protein
MVERQTRHLEGVVPSGVRVQIPLTAYIEKSLDYQGFLSFLAECS